MTWLLVTSGVAAVAAGIAPRHHGLSPRAVWADLRDLHTPGQLGILAVRLLLAVAVTVAARVGIVLLALVCAAGVAAVAAIGGAVYGLRILACHAEPPYRPATAATLDVTSTYTPITGPRELE